MITEANALVTMNTTYDMSNGMDATNQTKLIAAIHAGRSAKTGATAVSADESKVFLLRRAMGPRLDSTDSGEARLGACLH
jgi:hypothetical protein